MEYFIILGGVLSLPIIHYCTQPVPIQEKPEDEETLKETETKIDPVEEEARRKSAAEEMQRAKERAEKRKEKILKNLTPIEQELFKEYIQSLMKPDLKSSFERCFMLLIIFCFIALLIAGAYIIVNNGPGIVNSDL